mmetsp:Transcript_17603/g.40724  ORF Transcript_17603/g.40724 Transcript_17603/m.40724 type:complete len:128 (+) Transcript_17603:40-423(+)
MCPEVLRSCASWPLSGTRTIYKHCASHLGGHQLGVQPSSLTYEVPTGHCSRLQVSLVIHSSSAQGSQLNSSIHLIRWGMRFTTEEHLNDDKGKLAVYIYTGAIALGKDEMLVHWHGIMPPAQKLPWQ